MIYEKSLLFLTATITTLYALVIFIRSSNILLKTYTIGVIGIYIIPLYLFEFFIYNYKYYNVDINYKIISLMVINLTNIIIYIVTNHKVNGNKEKNKYKKYSTKLQKINPFIFVLAKIYSNFLGMYSIYLLISNISYINNNDILRIRITPLIYKVTFTGMLNSIALIIALIYLLRYLESKDKFNLIKFIYYYILELCSIFTLGQRTPLIVSIIIVGLVIIFYYRGNKKMQVYIFISMIFISLIVLLYYSTNFKRTLINEENLILKIINGDIDLNWTLWYTLRESSFVFNNIAPYPMIGWMYILTLFIPRSIWALKGYSTASWFTKSYLEYNSFQYVEISNLSWGYKFGVLQDFIINLGYFGIIAYAIIIGILFRLINRISKDNIILKAFVVTIAFRIVMNDVFVNVVYNIIPLILILSFGYIGNTYRDK